MISIFEIGNTVMNIIFLMQEIQEPQVLAGDLNHVPAVQDSAW